MSLLHAENIKLRTKIEDLEKRLLTLVGTIKIFTGGMAGNEHVMNNNIAEIITNATDIKIVAPYITNEYALILKDRARNGIKVQIVLNDRRLWPEKDVDVNIYDELKVSSGIDLINNPNVKYLLVWSPKTALFTSGPLDKNSLMKTVLIGTLINEKGKLNELLKIFQLMLPSFMH